MAKELSAEALEWLAGCTVVGNVVKLPENGYNKTVYQEVKNRLELIGGKWKGGKIWGFVFPTDPTEMLEQIKDGTKVNLKKEFQFFETPASIAGILVELADLSDGDLVLEPSAGRGAIIAAIYRKFPRIMLGPNDDPCVCVDYCELMPVNQDILSKKIHADKNWGSRTSFIGADFFKSIGTYKRIIANPPFSGNQDIDHIYHMYDRLKTGGRLVSIASKHWQSSSNKKESEFRTWLQNHDAAIIENSAGDFKDSGTMIATCIVVIDKK